MTSIAKRRAWLHNATLFQLMRRQSRLERQRRMWRWRIGSWASEKRNILDQRIAYVTALIASRYGLVRTSRRALWPRGHFRRLELYRQQIY